MSTRCFICVEDTVQGYRGIYCHYDGYPRHVGNILVEFHPGVTDALQIIHGPQIRNFDSDGTIARYGDGTLDDSEVHLDISDALHSGFDYVYLHDPKELRWKCFALDQLFNNIVYEVNIPNNQPSTKETANA